MKTVGEIMATDVVWVSPSARVKTAVILMKGHNIGALPVVQASEQVVGVVTYQNVLGQPNDAIIESVMTREFVSVGANMTVVDAAEVMVETGAEYLLVMEGDRLQGIVSHADLLPELGKTFDPLTGLPWSDQFREWAISALKRGQEISVIFFDLDKYGQFNKKHGHVVGDNVLKEVAEVFKRSTDAARDFVCRYGGDEFAVVSVRNAEEAVSLADFIKQGISRISIHEVPNGVSGSYGIFGGRRTNERREMHYAATIDDLITRASRNCIAAKPQREEAPGKTGQSPVSGEEKGSVPVFPVPQPIGRGRLKIHTINFSSSGSDASVSVILTQGEKQYSRESSGYLVEGSNTFRLVAEAAAGAARMALPGEHGIVIEDVLLQNDTRGEQIVTVVVTFITPRYSTRSAGSAVIKRGDQFRAAAAAVLDAVNRQMEVAPEREEDEGPAV